MKGKPVKLNIEQEIINLKALIEEREEDAVQKYQVKLMRKHLNHSYKVIPLSAEESQLYD